MLKKEPIIQQLEKMVENIPGWSPIDQLYTLNTLTMLTSNLDGDVLEVGAWCGRSAVGMASAIKLSDKKDKMISVDLFPHKDDWYENSDGSYSFKSTINNNAIDAYNVQTVWKEPFDRDIKPVYERYDSILDAWQENIDKNDLSDICIPYRGDSKMFFDQVPHDFKLRVAFLDGDHAYNAVVEDITQVEKYLVSGGFICFDDAFSHYDGVNKAIEDCIINSDKYDFSQQMTRKLFIARKK